MWNVVKYQTKSDKAAKKLRRLKTGNKEYRKYEAQIHEFPSSPLLKLSVTDQSGF